MRRVRGLPHPVVFAGSWVAGDIVMAADPIRLESSSTGAAPAAFDFLDHQPQLAGDVPSGAVGGGWFGWFGFEAGAAAQEYALGFYPNVLRLDAGQWWDEALSGLVPAPELEERRRRLSEVLDGAVTRPGAYHLGPVTPSRSRAGACRGGRALHPAHPGRRDLPGKISA